MSKRTKRIVRDLSNCSFKELLVVAVDLYNELGGPATAVLLSVLSQPRRISNTPLRLVLEDTPEKKIDIIRQLRSHFNLPLKVAQNLTENLPKKLPKTDRPIAVAEALGAAGALVRLVKD